MGFVNEISALNSEIDSNSAFSHSKKVLLFILQILERTFLKKVTTEKQIAEANSILLLDALGKRRFCQIENILPVVGLYRHCLNLTNKRIESECKDFTPGLSIDRMKNIIACFNSNKMENFIHQPAVPPLSVENFIFIHEFDETAIIFQNCPSCSIKLSWVEHFLIVF